MIFPCSASVQNCRLKEESIDQELALHDWMGPLGSSSLKIRGPIHPMLLDRYREVGWDIEKKEGSYIFSLPKDLQEELK